MTFSAAAPGFTQDQLDFFHSRSGKTHGRRRNLPGPRGNLALPLTLGDQPAQTQRPPASKRQERRGDRRRTKRRTALIGIPQF